jgi:alanine racemase
MSRPRDDSFDRRPVESTDMSAPISRFRPTVVRIDPAALRYNCRLLRSRVSASGCAVMAILRGDAFGHGLLATAKLFAEEEIDWLGVGTVEDGLRLRSGGVDLPILVLDGFTDGSEPDAIAAGLTPVVYRSASARALNALASRTGQPIGIHLEVDTGTNRQGVPRGLLGQFLELLSGLEHLYIDGLMTTLAEPGAPADDFTAWQLEGFDAAVDELAQGGHRPRWIHAASSAATMLRRGPTGASTPVLVRSAAALYGFAPGPSLEGAWPLRPAMGLESAISFLRRIPSGSRVSLGATWTARRATRLANVPIGYADGYPRAAGNRAEALVRGRRAPVVGQVCADQLLLDVTDVDGVQEGDLVTLLGSQDGERIGVVELATLAGTVPHDLLSGIDRELPRIHGDGPLDLLSLNALASAAEHGA